MKWDEFQRVEQAKAVLARGGLSYDQRKMFQRVVDDATRRQFEEEHRLAAAEEWSREYDRRRAAASSTKRHEAPVPTGPDLDLLCELAGYGLSRLSPAGKREVGRLIEAWERKRDAFRRRGRTMLAGLERGDGTLGLKTADCHVLELKADASGDMTCVVYGAVWNNVDHGGDVIIPGAVKNLDDFIRYGWLSDNHQNTRLQIGDIASAVSDDYGLRVVGRFHDTPEARAVQSVVRARLASGKPAPASIGYETVDSYQDARGGQRVRVLTAINVWEVSFVNRGMNQLAGFVSA